MTSKFKLQPPFDSDNDSKATRSRPNNDFEFKSYQSVVMRKQATQKDMYVPNKIAKNDFFVGEDAIFGEDKNSPFSKSQIMIDQARTQTMQNKSQAAKRKKVSTSIKLQPLRTLQLRKDIQKIEFVQATPSPPQLLKRQSEPVHTQSSVVVQEQLEVSKTLSSVYRSNLLNFEMESSSEEQQNYKREVDLDVEDISLKKPDLTSSSSLFFEEEDEQVENKPDNQKKEEEKKPELRQLKFKRALKKKSESTNSVKQIFPPETTKNPSEQIKPEHKPEQIVFNEDQKSNSQNQENQAKVGIEAEPNPQKTTLQEPNSNSTQKLQTAPQINTVQHEKHVNFQTMKRLILGQIQTGSVLNLRLIRSKSILNYFSPEFRLEFFQDSYFVMGCKKTSSKPTSTFVFTCSEFNYEETSKKYMGKMKSNLAGNVYNIYGPGLNPSNAKNLNVPPRQLLATIVYQTELFGTGRPKQFKVFVKKPDFMYYRDFRGVQMYGDEIPLHELYCNYQDNMDKIQVIDTRKPTYFKETKEYVMNFEGKVKKSSIKNFILEDRANQRSKTMLFGKINDDEYVLDVLNPFSPIVGIGIALTMFDSRMGSD